MWSRIQFLIDIQIFLKIIKQLYEGETILQIYYHIKAPYILLRDPIFNN